MTDDRALRSAVLATAAKAKSQIKTNAAEQAIRALVKRGLPVTFEAVRREAGLSHAFLYTHPDLRAQRRPAAAPRDPTDTVVLTLTTQINQLKQQHRQEMHALRAALERAHGENLELRRQLALRGGTAEATKA